MGCFKLACKRGFGPPDLRRVQPIRLRFQRVEVPPWELSVHPGSYNRLMKGRPDMGKLGSKSTRDLAKAEVVIPVGRATIQAVA
jgi:hypothetical protein